jgi:hypothetical protein
VFTSGPRSYSWVFRALQNLERDEEVPGEDIVVKVPRGVGDETPGRRPIGVRLAQGTLNQPRSQDMNLLTRYEDIERYRKFLKPETLPGASVPELIVRAKHHKIVRARV